MLELYRSLVDIEPILHKPVRQMSLGQRTLSDILAAFLHNPGIVFLDEPTIGLDVSMKAKIRELIKGHIGKITKSEIMAMCPDISQVTVQRALTELLKNNEITKIGGGRYTSYVWNGEE